jgi:hypothetical protein
LIAEHVLSSRARRRERKQFAWRDLAAYFSNEKTTPTML